MQSLGEDGIFLCWKLGRDINKLVRVNIVVKFLAVVMETGLETCDNLFWGLQSIILGREAV